MVLVIGDNLVERGKGKRGVLHELGHPIVVNHKRETGVPGQIESFKVGCPVSQKRHVDRESGLGDLFEDFGREEVLLPGPSQGHDRKRLRRPFGFGYQGRGNKGAAAAVK